MLAGLLLVLVVAVVPAGPAAAEHASGELLVARPAGCRAATTSDPVVATGSSMHYAECLAAWGNVVLATSVQDSNHNVGYYAPGTWSQPTQQHALCIGFGTSTDFSAISAVGVSFGGYTNMTGYMGGGINGAPVQSATMFPRWYWLTDASWTGSAASTCAGAAEGPTTEAADVDAPELACGRALRNDGGDDWSVKATARVTNPDARATDSFEWLFPWEGSWSAGATKGWQALPDITGQPSGGWKLTCKVTRTVDTADTWGSGDWAGFSDPASSDAVDCAPEDVQCLIDNGDGPPLSGAFTTPPAVSPLPWILTPPAAPPTQVPPGVVTPPSAPGILTRIGAVGGAAAIGWLAGGAISDVLDNHVDMDRDWLCRWNPGYRALNVDQCRQYQDIVPRERTQVLPLDPQGQPATRTQPRWKTMVALATVTVNVHKPLAGIQTQVSAADPLRKPQTQTVDTSTTPGTVTETQTVDRMSPEQQTELEQDQAEPQTSTPLVPAPQPTSTGTGSCWGGAWSLNPVDWVLTPVKCALQWAFVPTTDWTQLGTQLGEQFPFSVATEIVTALGRVHVMATDRMSYGNSCPVIDLRDILRSGAPDQIGDKVDGVLYRLPAPSSAQCPNATAIEKRIGDVLGFRELLRNVALFFMLVGFSLAVMRAFVDEDNEALEPTS